MSMSSPFIHRPVATTLLTMAIALAGGIGVLFPAGLPAAAGGISHHLRWRGAAGGKPRNDGVGGGHAAGTAIRTHRRRHGNDVAPAFMGTTSITLQFDLSRNIDAAARDVQAAINAARGQLPTNLPEQSDVSQGQSRRRADSCCWRLTSDTFTTGPDVRCGGVDPSAEDFAGARESGR